MQTATHEPDVLPPLRAAPEFSSAQQTAGYAIWWGDCTCPFFEDLPPAPADLARQPACRIPAGECEPLVLGLWGLRDSGTVTLEVEESPFPIDTMTVEFQERVVPRPPIPGGRRLGIPYWLPRQATTRVTAGKNAVFWLTVHVPEGTPAGEYQGKLSLVLHERGRVDSHYGRDELPRVQFAFAVRVLPFVLPPADIAYGMYFRPLLLDAPYREKPLMRQYYRDMAAHGHTSATVYAPDSIADEAGQLHPEGTRTAEIIQEMLDDGLIRPEIPVMLLGGHGQLDEAAANRFTAELREACHVRGWPEFLLYAPDEPTYTGERGPSCIEQFNHLQRYRPGCRLVTAISADAAQYFSAQLDVWVVHNGDIDGELQTLAADAGAEMWSYDCQHRGTNPTFNRFYPGLYSWALGLRGNFLWCYTDYDWYGWEKERYSPFNYVLPSLGGPVSSVGWETRREGIKDYRYLRELERRLDDGPGGPAASAARSWLEELKGRINTDSHANRPDTSERWDERDLWSQCPDILPDQFAGIRDKAVDLILGIAAG